MPPRCPRARPASTGLTAPGLVRTVTLMLRLRWLMFTRLLPVVGPLLLERDLLRVQVLAAALEIEVVRAQLRRASQPVLL